MKPVYGAFIVIWLYKFPIIDTSVMFSLSTVGRPLTSMIELSCQFGVNFSSLDSPKVVCQFVLIENALHSPSSSIGVSLSGRRGVLSRTHSRQRYNVSYFEMQYFGASLAIRSPPGMKSPCATLIVAGLHQLCYEWFIAQHFRKWNNSLISIGSRWLCSLFPCRLLFWCH